MNDRIAKVRKQLGYNQDVFSYKLGLTKNYISLVETGKRDPSDRTIKDICREFNVNENWLRTGEGDMFLPTDRHTEIAKFATDLFKGEKDSFKERLILALSKLNESGWETLENIVEKIAEKKD